MAELVSVHRRRGRHDLAEPAADGRFVSAAEALAIGLADKVVPDEQCAIDTGLETDLATGLECERLAFAGLFATEDASAGMRSFLENGPGKATFAGR